MSRLLFLRGRKRRDRALRLRDYGCPLFVSKEQTLRYDELRRDTNESENRLKIGLGMFVPSHGPTFAVEAAAGKGDDDPLVASQPDRACLAVAKSLASNQDAVDPGL